MMTATEDWLADLPPGDGTVDDRLWRRICKAIAVERMSKATRSALHYDTRLFIRWCIGEKCRAVPAEVATIVAYRDYLLGGRSAGTVRRYLRSVGWLHRIVGLPDPTLSDGSGNPRPPVGHIAFLRPARFRSLPDDVEANLERFDRCLQDRGNLAPATVKAMKSDVRLFLVWCLEKGVVGLPAAPETVRGYLAAARHGRKLTTLDRYCNSIGAFHRAMNCEDPFNEPTVRSARPRVLRKRRDDGRKRRDDGGRVAEPDEARI